MINKIILMCGLSLLTFRVKGSTVLPFQLVGKLIVIQAVVNDQMGNYILDTGTSNLVLNNQYHDPVFAGRKRKALGISGRPVKMVESFVDLQIGELKWRSLTAEVMSLEHLSRAKNLPIMGLIGTYVFRNYQLIIDFDNREILLTKVAGKHKEAPIDPGQPANVLLPIRTKAGIPVIEMQIEGVSLDFGLDTGSEVNIMDAKYLKPLKGGFSPGRAVKMLDVFQHPQLVNTGFLKNVIIDQFYCSNLKIAILPLKKFNLNTSGQSLNGLLSSDFIAHFKTSINFPAGRVKLWYRSGIEKLIYAKKD